MQLSPRNKQLATLLVALVSVAAIAFTLGHNRSTTNATASTAPSVDQSIIAPLMKKLLSNPNDTKTLWALGNEYFSANDFAGAQPYYEKLATLTPKDDGVWIAVGAVAFNLGDDARAKTAWQRAMRLNPKNAEAHYNMGFWYLVQKPPQEDKARAEWQKVIDIDPTSQFAKDVMARLSQTGSPTPVK